MQPTLEGVAKTLDRLNPLHRQLKEESIFILESALNEANIKYHSIGGRIKDAQSAFKKMERKQLNEPMELNDLVGVRIVCLFLSDITKIGKVIRHAFDVTEEDNKIEDKDTESFGYLSFHFIARIKQSYSGPRYDSIRTLSLEIQVRTIAMDAWAATSHYLDYKSEEDVPKELKKDFFALSGLFYVADQHFEIFYKTRGASKKAIAKELKESPTGANIELNLDTLYEYLKRQFPDRDARDANLVSDLLKELKEHGFRTIDQLDDIIRKTKTALASFEGESTYWVQSNGRRLRASAVGAVRYALSLWDEKYSRSTSGVALQPYRTLVNR